MPAATSKSPDLAFGVDIRATTRDVPAKARPLPKRVFLNLNPTNEGSKRSRAEVCNHPKARTAPRHEPAGLTREIGRPFSRPRRRRRLKKTSSRMGSCTTPRTETSRATAQ